MQESNKKTLKQRFSAKRIALMAVFVALSYVVSFLEIPMQLFGASFLKLDFGNVFIILISFLLGPVEGVIVCLLKESLRLLSSSSGGAGEIANFFGDELVLIAPVHCLLLSKRLYSRDFDALRGVFDRDGNGATCQPLDRLPILFSIGRERDV